LIYALNALDPIWATLKEELKSFWTWISSFGGSIKRQGKRLLGSIHRNRDNTLPFVEGSMVLDRYKL